MSLTYYHYTGSAGSAPTITNTIPSNATITVGSYSDGYYTITVPDTGAQFVVNWGTYNPVPVIVMPDNATVDLSSVTSAISTVDGKVNTLTTNLSTANSNITTIDGIVDYLTTNLSAATQLLYDEDQTIISNLSDAVSALSGDIDDAASSINSYISNKTDIITGILGTPTTTIANDIHMIRSTGGDGDVPVVITIENTLGQSVASAEVWITDDNEGEDSYDIVAGTIYSSTNGTVRFLLNSGWYWVHFQKDTELNYTTYRFQVV